jgi:hypothetical protein
MGQNNDQRRRSKFDNGGQAGGMSRFSTNPINNQKFQKLSPLEALANPALADRINAEQPPQDKKQPIPLHLAMGQQHATFTLPG